MKQWAPVAITPDMLDAEGRIVWPGPGASAFFRMAITGGPPDPGLLTVQGGTLVTSNALNGTIVSAFEIGRHEVTWGEWKAVRAEAATRGYDIGGVGAGCADDHPVNTVNWYEVVKWCNLKSEIKGRTPVYRVSGNVYRSGQSIPTWDISANDFRLPTEVEWEFAARGGGQTHGYSGSNNLNGVGARTAIGAIDPTQRPGVAPAFGVG